MGFENNFFMRAKLGSVPIFKLTCLLLAFGARAVIQGVEKKERDYGDFRQPAVATNVGLRA